MLPRGSGPAAVLLAALALAGCARFEPRPLAPDQTAADLESRRLDSPALKAFLEQNLKRPLPDWPPAQWDEPMLTLAAFYYHPSLDVARARWAVAQAGIKTAAGRPNPTLTFGPGASLNPIGTTPWEPFVNLSIPLETAGKRRYRTTQASQLSEAARLNLASTAWQVVSNLRLSLLDYTAARQRAALLEQQLHLQQQIVALLEERLRVGAVARMDLTVSRLALARAEADYADATRQTAEGRVRVAEALGLPLKGIEGAEFRFPLAVAAEAGGDLTSAGVRRQALLGRPDVLSALAEYAASQSALQLEIARQYPDVHLNPGYMFDEGEHKWSLGMGVDLPVLNQNQGPIAEAKARRQELAARFAALQAKVIAQIDGALAARAAALEQLRRQARLTELASVQAASAQALFKAGAADKLELASAQLEADANRLVFFEAQVKARQAIAQLEDAIQRPLEPWPSLERPPALQAHSPPNPNPQEKQ
jgi:outer membrane protein TolC